MDTVKEEKTETGGEEQPYHYNRELFYSFDKEKGYSQRVDYMIPENQTIIRQQWDLVEERLKGIRYLVTSGKRSPIAWYMEKALMEIPMLAGYMEMSAWRIRWHITPMGFKQLKPRILEKYAALFGITVEALKHPDLENNLR